MFSRVFAINPKSKKSFFLLGPRGTGKTYWVQHHFPQAFYLDLLNTSLYHTLLANPSRLESLIPIDFKDWIVIDEVQKIPELLNEVHRLIEKKHYRFVLTGSSARSLKRKGVNLLAGRAINHMLHPLIAQEMGSQFILKRALHYGMLPSIYTDDVADPKAYLHTYVTNYLREEVLQEGLTRNLSEFTRFLETASFSQGATLNFSDIARDAAIDRKIVSSYFDIVEDLLIAVRLPVFTKRAKRRLVASPKFYYFDAGVYRTLRPKGPLDSPEEIDGAALETLFLQHLRAINDYYQLGYQIYYWRTSNDVEVDFIVYGERGFHAFEIKRKAKYSTSDLSGLKAFAKDYPKANGYLIYGGERAEHNNGIKILPFTQALLELEKILA